MCGFIAQLVKHRTGVAEVTGSNPVELKKKPTFFLASTFQRFFLFSSICLNLVSAFLEYYNKVPVTDELRIPLKLSIEREKKCVCRERKDLVGHLIFCASVPGNCPS